MANRIYQAKAKLIKNIEVTKNYYKIILSCPRIAKMAEPGQFLQVKVGEGDEPLLRRPFSIHRVGYRLSVIGYRPQTAKSGKPNTIEILYEVVGKGTQVLSQRKAGEYLDVIGPLGQGFDYSAPVLECSSAPVLVAGGMGVAPLFFLAEQLMKRNTQYPIRNTLVLIGAQTKTQILCEKEFKRLGCAVRIATDDGSAGLKGKVTGLLKYLLSTIDYRLSTIYACGPYPMLKEISRISKQHNIPAQISLEEHLACGIGACLGCVVNTQYAIRNTHPSAMLRMRPERNRGTQYGFQYKRVCKEGPVFNAEEIVWSNEDETYGTK